MTTCASNTESTSAFGGDTSPLARGLCHAREQVERWAYSFLLFAVSSRACVELGVRACALRAR
eukprot:7909885-Lingulodinium_polyedra.AAC.1